MLGKLLVFGLFSLVAASAQTARDVEPTRVVIGEYDQRGWTVTEIISVSSSESRMRQITADTNCEKPHVTRAEEFHFQQESVRDLVSKAEVCVSEKRLSALVQSLKTRKQSRDTGDDNDDDDPDGLIGRKRMEVQCGTDVIVHDLPNRDSFRFSSLKRKWPGIAALWDLYDDLNQRASKLEKPRLTESESEQERTKDRERMLSAAFDIKGGKFDLVLDGLDEWQQAEGRTRLSELMPSPEEAINRENYGEVENLDQLGLAKKPDLIPYPQIALVARIQGDVQVEVSVDYASGRVLSSTANSGHPILRAGSIDAINRWLFVAPYSGPNPLSVNVHFNHVRCAPLIETSRSTVAKKGAKKKKKKAKH